MKPEILGMTEFAQRTGIKIGTLYQMQQRRQLPEPDGWINGGTRAWWLSTTIDRWQEARER